MSQLLADPVREYLQAVPNLGPQHLKSLLEQQYPQRPRRPSFKLATPEDEWRLRLKFLKAVSQAQDAAQQITLQLTLNSCPAAISSTTTQPSKPEPEQKRHDHPDRKPKSHGQSRPR